MNKRFCKGDYKKTCLVLGAGGFIGHHLVKKLKKEGCWVRGVDLKHPEFEKTNADEFIIADLRDEMKVSLVMLAPNQHSLDDVENSFDEVYQLAADMGGAGFVFTGENDADIMHNSCLININVVKMAVKFRIKKIFYSSSACIYPEGKQTKTNNPGLMESDAYPAYPDSEYGWEKIFSERLYLAFAKNYGLNIRIARFHNICGELGTWTGGREKAPAAMCRKVAEAIKTNSNYIEIWGDGNQTRSFLHVHECLDGIERLMNSEIKEPINIGSDEMVSINELAKIVMNIAGVNLEIKHIAGPLGVRGRNSENTLIKERLDWKPNYPLKNAIEKIYPWVRDMVNKQK